MGEERSVTGSRLMLRVGRVGPHWREKESIEVEGEARSPRVQVAVGRVEGDAAGRKSNVKKGKRVDGWQAECVYLTSA